MGSLQPGREPSLGSSLASHDPGLPQTPELRELRAFCGHAAQPEVLSGTAAQTAEATSSRPALQQALF